MEQREHHHKWHVETEHRAPTDWVGKKIIERRLIDVDVFEEHSEDRQRQHNMYDENKVDSVFDDRVHITAADRLSLNIINMVWRLRLHNFERFYHLLVFKTLILIFKLFYSVFNFSIWKVIR